MYKIQLLNINLQKSSRKLQNNTLLIINYSNQILNKINITKIINDKFYQFPLKDHKISRTLNIEKHLVE